MQSKNPGHRLVAAAFCLLVLLAAPSLRGQEPAPTATSSLVINILSGEGALNDIRQRTAREPIVQVEDQNHKPVAGAVVIFLLPDSGPSGTFANGSRSFSTVTDADGHAAAHGLHPNQNVGTWNIVVQAQMAGVTATATIHQQNVPGASSASNTTMHTTHVLSTKGILIGAACAAAAAGIVAGILLTRSNSTSITPGTPTVGAPTTATVIHISLSRHAH